MEFGEWLNGLKWSRILHAPTSSSEKRIFIGSDRRKKMKLVFIRRSSVESCRNWRLNETDVPEKNNWPEFCRRFFAGSWSAAVSALLLQNIQQFLSPRPAHQSRNLPPESRRVFPPRCCAGLRDGANSCRRHGLPQTSSHRQPGRQIRRDIQRPRLKNVRSCQPKRTSTTLEKENLHSR